MENFRGICTRCGASHSDKNHTCTDDDVRLLDIDRTWGQRHIREWMIANGVAVSVIKNGKTLFDAEQEAAEIRSRKNGGQ